MLIEFDGSGHRLRVKCGSLTNDEFDNKEMSRNYYLMNNGWKQIRIISSNDKLPTNDKLLDIFNYGVDYLNKGHRYIIFDIDKNNVTTSQFIQNYNYGVLHYVKSEAV